MSSWSEKDWENWISLELWRQEDTLWWRTQEQYEARQQLRRERKASGTHQKCKLEAKLRREAREVREIRRVVLTGPGGKKQRNSATSTATSSSSTADVSVNTVNVDVDIAQQDPDQETPKYLQQNHEQDSATKGRWRLLE